MVEGLRKNCGRYKNSQTKYTPLQKSKRTLLSPPPGGHTDSYQPPLQRRQVPVSDVASYDVTTGQGGAHHPAPGHRVMSCHHVMSSCHVLMSSCHHVIMSSCHVTAPGHHVHDGDGHLIHQRVAVRVTEVYHGVNLYKIEHTKERKVLMENGI